VSLLATRTVTWSWWSTANLTLRTEFEELETQLLPLASRGLSYGVHLLVSANRWSELRPRAERPCWAPGSSCGWATRPIPRWIRRRAALVPVKPGRGLAPDGGHCVIARPALDSIGGGFAEAVAEVAASWSGPSVPSVRLLPDRMDYRELLARRTALTAAGTVPAQHAARAADRRGRGPVGAGLPQLRRRAAPALLRRRESGKTNLLRVLARGLTQQLSPERARVVLIDYRRTLLGQVPDSHLIGYASNGEAAARRSATWPPRFAAACPART